MLKAQQTYKLVAMQNMEAEEEVEPGLRLVAVIAEEAQYMVLAVEAEEQEAVVLLGLAVPGQAMLLVKVQQE